MRTFRLVNTATWAVESFEIGQAPPYLAISHAWSDCIFPKHGNFGQSFGSGAIRQTIQQRGLHQVGYCWIDLFCIIQDSEDDMCEQMPLMSHIYGDAKVVLIILTNKLNLTQEQVDHGSAELDEALAIWDAESWTDEGAREYWVLGPGRAKLVQAMEVLSRFTSAAWGTRVWTLQEYLLAADVLWIGADLEPVSISDELFVAIPRLCEEWELLFSHFSGMAARRTGATDPTRVMEMFGNRRAFLPVDEVYGAMAVSTVEIGVRPRESRESAWRRWTQAALAAGHLRWLMVPPAMPAAGDDAAELTCEGVPCPKRHMLSAASGLDAVTPYGPVIVSENTVRFAARRIGTCTVLHKLGPVYRCSSDFVHRDLTLILYARGVWSSAIDIAVAFGAGRYSNKQIIMIAQILANNYQRALHFIKKRAENKFYPILESERYRFVWADLMQLQSQSVMDTLNFGFGHLIRVKCPATHIPFVTVLATNGRCPDGDLVAFDCNARSGDRRHTLLIAERSAADAQKQDGDPDAPWHKAGVTISVGKDYATAWDLIPLSEISVGGLNCKVCKQDSAPDGAVRTPIATPSPRRDYARNMRLQIEDIKCCEQ
ncbi:HET domain protein [Beauveria bassiana ARSEF 2860]|uniref:HET domain protein n=1 Tax=Beauveria bassiana (strain ARSEF 2860) TaxID=655819 RepID=J5JAP3_BEAB2|nr:HET domain protein [Beauveria bassiana ARSEF 2860]EJP61086.1 HET domain protein [Beauveria bassiana ARSEF 2860]